LAARRCPWCLKDYSSPSNIPEHLFATLDRPGRPLPAPRQNGDK
jgi:hypothetical protein